MLVARCRALCAQTRGTGVDALLRRHNLSCSLFFRIKVDLDMQAWVVRKTGVPSTSRHFQLEEDYSIPVPTGKEVLIKVKAVGMNIGSGAKPMFAYPFRLLQKHPGVPEHEFSGQVAGGKLDDAGLALGDEVFGILAFPDHITSGVGALAEYTVIDPELLLRKPPTLSHSEAAASTMALILPYFALVKQAGIHEGNPKRVFVNGGSGVTGQGAIQVAKAFGAYVVSTGSPESEPLLRSLGVDEVIDYRSVDLISHLTSTQSGSNMLDVIFDTVGNHKLYRASPRFLKPDGVYQNIGGPEPSLGEFLKYGLSIAQTKIPAFLGGTPRRYEFVLVPQEIWGKTMREAWELHRSGKFKARIDSEFAMADAKQAYAGVLSGRSKGKVVVLVA